MSGQYLIGTMDLLPPWSKKEEEPYLDATHTGWLESTV